ncbi:MAG: TfoX/Sxy family protein [Candidatus Krumholzibacteriia bacterium]
MAADDSFLTFVCDQLGGLGDVHSRAMFGGHGVYSGGVFFAIVHGGRLYFKTNEETRPKYSEAGMSCFQPKPHQGLRNYLEVPVDVLEGSELVAWALDAVRVGKAMAAPRSPKRRVAKKR